MLDLELVALQTPFQLSMLSSQQTKFSRACHTVVGLDADTERAGVCNAELAMLLVIQCLHAQLLIMVPVLVCQQVWPKDALEAVAYKFLKEMDLDDPTRAKLVELCQSVHRKVSLLSVMVSCSMWQSLFTSLPLMPVLGNEGIDTFSYLPG